MSGAQGQWLRERERGSMFGIRALLLAHRVFGRGFAVLILRVVAFYYVVFSGRVRRTSRDYLRRVIDDRPRRALAPACPADHAPDRRERA